MTSPRKRVRINWQNYAKAGPVTITRADGTIEVQPPLQPRQVKAVVEKRLKH